MQEILSKKVVVAAGVVALALIAFWGIRQIGKGNFNIGADNTQKAEIVKIEGPEISRIGENNIVPQPVRILFSNNIARAGLINHKVLKGIEMKPSLRGEWRFEGASVLVFEPKEDWLPDVTYDITLVKDILAPDVILKKNSFSFKSPSFSGKKIESEFYEDPRNRYNKAAVAGFEFSYPVREDSIKQAVTVQSVGGKKYDFTYKLRDKNRRLYILSAPLTIGNEADFVTITAAGLKNSSNDKPLVKPVSAKITVPGVNSFFNIKSITAEIVRNDKKNNEPEQVLKVAFTSTAEAKNVADYLQLFYSDDNCYLLKENLAKAGNDRTKPENLKPLEMTFIERAKADDNTYWFKYNLEQRNKCLMAVVKKRLSSVDGFMLTTDAVQLLPEANYPLEAKIAYSGAVVPLTQNPQLEFMSRGVKKLQVRLARIESDDLNNLVTQTGGQFASPYFLNYNFNEYNMAEVFEKNIPVNMQNPAETNYASLNLKPYIGNRKGIFIVLLKGIFDDNNVSPEDRRLVIVTDLGLVVKDNLDNSHDVFVSSLTKEKPVAGATVEVLGRNGISIVNAKTDASGHAKLPDLSGFENEKQPVAYKVSLNGDVSYLPFDRYELRINYSRFVVGGVYAPEDKPDGVNVYIFSDRGIYRPGEKVHLGMMVRQNNLKVPAHLPFEVQIMNPRGEEAASAKLSTSADGLAEYTYAVPANADTGFYNLSLYRLNDKQEKIYVASSYFRVEEFEADTMKLKLKFEGDKPKGWFDTDSAEVRATLSNLYGNPAAGHVLKGDYRLEPGYFYFKEYEQYTFVDPLRQKDNPVTASHSEKLKEVKSDENGQAVFKLDFGKYKKGTYRLSVKIDGMEAGAGRGVSNELSAFVSPNKYLVGYKADGSLFGIAKKAGRRVDLIAVDNNLQKIAKDGLKLQLKQKTDVSNLVEMPNGTYRYQTVTEEKLLKEEDFSLSAEGRKIELDTAENGAFILQISDGSAVVAKIDYTVETSAALTKVVDKAATLTVKTDKTEYASGEEIKLDIAAPYEGYGLITIERDSVYAYKWFKAEGKNLKASIKLPDTVEGNAYLNVSWFRDLKSDEIFMPPMSYAVVPFAINKSARDIKPLLDMPEKVRPGDKLVVKYKTKKPAEVIIWGVNEGVLQVAEYETPNPLEFFLKKKALRVVTAQIMDMIMPDANLSHFVKAPGGGMFAKAMSRSMLNAEMASDAGSANPFARKLNKITAFWSGILPADTTEKEFVYEVPETFSGQIRVMAVAVNAEQFGSTDSDVLVRGDFAIVPSGPFAATPGDEFTVGAGVANLVDGGGKDYSVRLSAVASGGLEILGDKEQVFNLPEGDEKTFVFKVRALEALGPAEIKFTVESLAKDGKKAVMPYYMGIRPAAPFMTKLDMGYRKDKLKLDDKMLVLYPQYRTQVLSASTSPLVLANGLLKYLDKFEHPCTEQTISKAYPAVALMFKHPEMIDSAAVYEQFEETIRVLQDRQKLNGGFGVWPVARLPENTAVSLYAAEFLVEADKSGLNVPRNLLDKSLQYARSVAAQNPKDIDDVHPAWAAYILTRHGEITTNYLLNLENELTKLDAKNWRNSLSAAYLASGYKMLQNEQKALSVLGRYKPSENKLDTVRYLYVMAENFPEQFKTWDKENIELLMSPLDKGYYNTWNAAYSILAMNAFAGQPEEDKKITFGDREGEYNLFANLSLNAGDNKITAVSPNPFFYVLRQQGYAEGKILKPEADGMEIAKEYLIDGKRIDKAKLGDVIDVVIRIRSLTGENIRDAAVVDLLPGGTDIVRDSVESGDADFSETREDRLNAYLTVTPAGVEVKYKIKAVSKGNFAVPPAYVSAMYDIQLNAHNMTAGLVIE